MLVIGIETSGRRGSVALCRDEETLHVIRFPGTARHARDIMTSVDDLLRAAGVDKHDVDAVAVSEGPGSFTGLRVGVTCAKTLAHLLGWQAVGVPSLEVLAQNVDAAECGCTATCPLRDARRSFVYGTVFLLEDGRWVDKTGVMAGEPQDVLARIPPGAFVFGSGVKAYPDVFDARGPDGKRILRVGPEKLDEGRAEEVARLGLLRIRAGGAVPAMQLLARYYRQTEAEEKAGLRHD